MTAQPNRRAILAGAPAAVALATLTAGAAAALSPGFAAALERHKAVQAAVDAAIEDENDVGPGDLISAEWDAFTELARTPCASDAEFREKIVYVFAHAKHVWRSEWQYYAHEHIIAALALHLNLEA